MKKTVHCQDVLENLSCYIDGDGAAELREAIVRHLAHCRRCRVIVDTTNRTLKLVLDVDPFEVPLAVSGRLYTRLERVLSGDSPIGGSEIQ
jgi:ribose 5-phosphate isomerase